MFKVRIGVYIKGILSVLTMALIGLTGSQVFAKRGFYKGPMLTSSTNNEGTSRFYNTPQDFKPNASGIRLVYFGGQIISQVKVVTVFWNKDVKKEIQTEIPNFYAEFVNSHHIDWLTEYNTNITAINGRAGTNQSFSRGQMIGTVLLNPSQTNHEITDEQIQSEILYQLDQQKLPTPDANTLYAIHFPGNISINADGSMSCVAFGGYHNGFKQAKYGDIFYTVIPECFSGSLDANASFNYTTVVASHEVIEAITDAFPTPGDKPSYPQAWNTTDGYEIADVCTYASATLKGTKRSYAISSEWSNKRDKCYDGTPDSTGTN